MFENEIKKLAKICISDFQIKNKSLKTILKGLVQYNIGDKPDLKTHIWLKRREMRNWLVHKNSNSNVPSKYLTLMSSIEKDLEEITLF